MTNYDHLDTRVTQKLLDQQGEINDLKARLARIAQAHTKAVDGHGGTDGYCTECDLLWPCPTSVWATTARNPDATWDPADDEPEDDPKPETLPCSRANLDRPHVSHSWQPQPGMRPILCEGVPLPGQADGASR